VISGYGIQAFRQKLKELVDERAFTSGYIIPMVYDRVSRKPFYGEITAHSFKLKRNSRIGTASYYIDGKYHELDGRTLVTFEFKRMTFEFYLIRVFPVFMFVAINGLLFASMPLTDLLKIDLFLAVFFVGIPLDNYFRRRLLKAFIKELNLSNIKSAS
jgi:hypothetical protein